MSVDPEPFEPDFEAAVVEEMRARLRATRWPAPVRPEDGEDGWEWGVDLGFVAGLCRWWADEYDPGGLAERLSEWPGFRWRGVHFLHARSPGDGVPVVLLHGWPGAPLEFRRLIGPLVAAGHDVVVPSLPGYGFSAAGDPPLSASGVADLFAALLETLGYRRYAVQGGDWGSMIGARMAFAHGEQVAGFHCSFPGALPLPGEVGDPGLDEGEIAYASHAQRWRSREAFHMLVHGLAPDSLGVGLCDSPAALAAWLVPRYRLWSDCEGEIERRFSKRDLCDFLTFYWATDTAASALRLYAATRRDRWRLAPGERISVPTAVADFPGEIVRPPRQWSERVLADLRSWTEMPSGGHFAAWEEPKLLGDDLIAFLRTL